LIEQGSLYAGYGVYTGTAELKDGPIWVLPLKRFLKELTAGAVLAAGRQTRRTSHPLLALPVRQSDLGARLPDVPHAGRAQAVSGVDPVRVGNADPGPTCIALDRPTQVPCRGLGVGMAGQSLYTQHVAVQVELTHDERAPQGLGSEPTDPRLLPDPPDTIVYAHVAQGPATLTDQQGICTPGPLSVKLCIAPDQGRHPVIQRNRPLHLPMPVSDPQPGPLAKAGVSDRDPADLHCLEPCIQEQVDDEFVHDRADPSPAPGLIGLALHTRNDAGYRLGRECPGLASSSAS